MASPIQADPLTEAEAITVAVEIGRRIELLERDCAEAENERRARLAAEMHHDGTPREPEPSRDAMGGGLDVDEDEERTIYHRDSQGALGPAQDRPLITSVRIIPQYQHARIRVWNRGGCSGDLVVDASDADAVAELLIPTSERRAEP